jgi:uncharacterized protein YqjF (DUF2071 family)
MALATPQPQSARNERRLMAATLEAILSHPANPAPVARRTRWSGPNLNATTTLRDFAIVTYAVEPKRLAALLPPGFEAETFTLGDGSSRGFVSAVPFRDLDFRLACAPALRFAFGQINYRAYVRYRGERAVWFFGTMLDSPLVAVPRYFWRLPWHHARISIEASWAGARCESYALDAHASWGNAGLRCTGTAQDAGCIDGFADAAETSLVLTHPLRGYYYRRDGRIGTYSVDHERFAMKRAATAEARFTVFEDLGLLETTAQPHSVLLLAETVFTIALPPRALSP